MNLLITESSNWLFSSSLHPDAPLWLELSAVRQEESGAWSSQSETDRIHYMTKILWAGSILLVWSHSFFSDTTAQHLLVTLLNIYKLHVKEKSLSSLVFTHWSKITPWYQQALALTSTFLHFYPRGLCFHLSLLLHSCDVRIIWITSFPRGKFTWTASHVRKTPLR